MVVSSVSESRWRDILSVRCAIFDFGTVYVEGYVQLKNEINKLKSISL